MEAFFLFNVGAMLSLGTCGTGTKRRDIGTCLIPHGMGSGLLSAGSLGGISTQPQET